MEKTPEQPPAREKPRESLPPRLQAALEKFQNWCQAELDEEEKRDRIIEPLYQYTTAAGLQGILESEAMWFTDYRHLNDPSEVRYGVATIKEVIQEASQLAKPQVKQLLECTDSHFSVENLKNFDFFVACFSRSRDELGQWRAYGDNGRGFAIGFAPKMFAAKRAKPDLLPEEHSFVGPVRYERDEIRQRSRRAIDHAINFFLTAVVENFDIMSEWAVRDAFIQDFSRQLLGDQLVWHALTSKHHAYKNECEVRILMLGSGSMLKGVTKTRMRGSTEFVPYIAHPWSVRGPGNIVEVVAGPAAAASVAKSLLAIGGISDVAVNASGIPYRPV